MNIENKLTERRNYYIVYTFSFLVMMLIISLPLLINGKSFIWVIDAVPLHTTNTVYLNEYIEQITSYPFGQIDFTIGMGTDPMLWLSTWYTEPLNLIGTFFKGDAIEYAYNLLIILRFYLVGLSFSVLARKYKMSNYQTLFGALIYTFCGYAIFAGFRHPIFLVGLIFLPLLICFLESVINKKNPFPFIILVFISTVANYYFMYINTLLMITYLLIRYVSSKKDRIDSFNLIKTGLRVSAYYLIGLAMSAYNLLPSLLHISSSVRASKTMSLYSMIFYDISYYGKVFSVFITPALSAGYWIRLSLPAIAYICVIFLFARKKRTSFFRYTFITLTLFLLIPFFAYAFSGFSSITNRWCYGYSLFLSIICAYQVHNLLNITEKELKILLIASCIFIPYLFVNKYTFIGTCCLGLFLLVITLNHYSKIDLRTAKYFLICVLAINLFLNSLFLFGHFAKNYSNEFLNSGTLYDTLFNQKTEKYTKTLSSKQGEFYRFDYQPAEYESGNRAILENYFGLSSTYSVYTKEFIKYSMMLDNVGLEATNFFEGFDSRMTLNALASVKYLIGNGKTDIIPFGYDAILQDDFCTIYQNRYANPIGFFYTKYMTEADFNNLSSLDKQEALLNTVIIKEDTLHLKKETEAVADYEVFKATGQPEYIVVNRGEKIRLYFKGIPEKENYLYIKNITTKSEVKDKNYPTIETSDGSKTDFCIMSSANTYTLNRKEYLICLGYSKSGIAYCDIGLPEDAIAKQIKFNQSDIELLCLSTNSYEGAMESFSQSTIKDVNLLPNKVTLTACTSSSGILNLSIPYLKGWSVKVDGEKTDIINTNIMYTGVYLNEGTHEIELSYKRPGQTTGYIISIIGFVMFVTLFIYIIKKHKLSNCKTI